MENDLNEILIYVKVVESGSFSAAAKVLGLPKSTVSAKVSSLEKRLGLTLIQRTTRKLHITPVGQNFYLRSAAGLAEIETAQAEVASSQSEPQGVLRITAPSDLGSSVLPKIVSDFMKKYKKIKLEMIFSDRRVDLISEGIDLAIRAGSLPSSSLKSKKLGSVYFVTLASPQYLKQQGMPRTPKELSGHECIQFAQAGFEDWKMSSAKGSVSVPLSGKILINDLVMVKSMALAGHGVALLPTFLCSAEINKGTLVRVLPEWTANKADVHFVYPDQKFVQPKLSAFISFATDPLREALREFEV